MSDQLEIARREIPEVDTDQTAARTLGTLLLDCRDQNEWDQGHIPGAVLIPLSELEARIGSEMELADRDREVIVYCRSGRRSLVGGLILKRAGFTAVSSMAGGIIAWREANRPVE